MTHPDADWEGIDRGLIDREADSGAPGVGQAGRRVCQLEPRRGSGYPKFSRLYNRGGS